MKLGIIILFVKLFKTQQTFIIIVAIKITQKTTMIYRILFYFYIKYPHTKYESYKCVWYTFKWGNKIHVWNREQFYDDKIQNILYTATLLLMLN